MKKLLPLLLISFFTQIIQAKEFWIIQTNDLHSHFNGVYKFDKAGKTIKAGGYAKLKFIFDRIKTDAKRKNVPFVQLDSGDFSEGGVFYLANEGLDTFTILDDLGYDGVALGNHDFLMGIPHMNKILGRTKLSYPVLSANFSAHNEFTNVKKNVQPYLVKQMQDGFKIAVMGLTTSEMFYKWRVKKHGNVSNPLEKAKSVAKYLKEKAKADVVIALTHIGIDDDKKLAKDSSYIDYIVGGHSHTLVDPRQTQVKNKKNKMVLISQMGEHGQYVGLVKLDWDGKNLKLLDFKKIEVDPLTPDSIDIQKKIAQTEESLERAYPHINEVVGHTSAPIIGNTETPSSIDVFFTDTLREHAKTDIAFNIGQFIGPMIPAGEIRQRDLYYLYPRMFDFEDKMGWNIYTAKIPGHWIKFVLRVAQNTNNAFIVSGMKFDKTKKNKKTKLSNFTINGKKILGTKQYTVAVPEGFLRAADEITKLTHIVFRKISNSHESIWQANIDRLKQNPNYFVQARKSYFIAPADLVEEEKANQINL